MNRIFHQQTKKPLRGRTALVAALAIGCFFGTATYAPAQTVTPPPTPTLITPPEGNTAFLLGHALGTQGYICLPTAPGASTAAAHRLCTSFRLTPRRRSISGVKRIERRPPHPHREDRRLASPATLLA